MMKKVLTLIWIVGGIAYVGGAYAQQAGAAKNKAIRGKGKEEYAEDATARWEQLKKGFAERERKKDPFGARMDPGTFEETVVVPDAPVKSAPVAAPKKVASLQEAVDKFQVNGVSPKKQMVMVGFRALHRGDIVEISHDGELFKLRIVKISKDEVIFMNTKNEETASVLLGVVKGFSRPQKSDNALQKNILKKNEPVRIK